MVDQVPERKDETLHEYMTRRWGSLKDERTSWMSHWKEITDFTAPRHGRYQISDRNKGRKKNTKITDGAASMASRTMVAGMQSGMTSPARPWFRLGPPDPEMREFGPVKDWLEQAQRIILRILAKSNFYNSMQSVYGELGNFGTNVLYRERDFQSVVRFYPFTVGEYAISEDQSFRVDTVFREFELTVRQCVQKFGYENVSNQTRNNYDNSDYEIPVQIIHGMEPNVDRDVLRPDNRNMPFRSVYIEKGSSTPIKGAEDQNSALRFSGYRRKPFYGTRWDILFGDVYGRSPGMDALGDVKQLQTQTRRKGQAIDKQVNPPLIGHPSLKNKGVTVLPGGINYADSRSGTPALAPVYTVEPKLQDMNLDMGEVRQRIDKWYYADLFAMMIESDRREITATEVAIRQQEKLVLLGPVIQRLNSELFDPLIEDLFVDVLELGLLPPPPPDLEGMELEIEYISLLQQAQQAVGVNAMDRLVGFVLGVAEASPEALDKVDIDQMIDEYATVLGVPSSVVRSDDEVANLRAARQEAQQQAEQAAIAQQQAETAKTMSETPVGETDALEQVLSGVGALSPTTNRVQ